MSVRPDLPPIRLTDLTDCGGCAAKLGADLLADALAGLGAGAASVAADAGEGLIAGLEPPDDAAAYRVTDDLAILGTLDFFPPLVDDPVAFGEIAAANALSDVFAMGGRVLFALSIAAFPEELPKEVLAAVFEAAAGKVREAGGVARRRPHDPRPGAQVRPGRDRRGAPRPPVPQGRRAAGGRPAADQAPGHRPPGERPAAGCGRRRRTSTPRSPRCAPSTAPRPRSWPATAIRGATDVTGFGLLGHGLEMARASGARLVFEAASLPALDGALRGGAGRRRDRRRGPQPALHRAGPHGGGRGRAGARRPSPTTRRHRAGCSQPCRRRSCAAVEADLAAAGVEAWQVGRVEPLVDGDAPGVALR